jgi:hypothetical protein
MRSILVGILVLSPLIIVLLGAHAQGGARTLRDLLQAPVGHRQPTVQGAQDTQENSRQITTSCICSRSRCRVGPVPDDIDRVTVTLIALSC